MPQLSSTAIRAITLGYCVMLGANAWAQGVATYGPLPSIPKIDARPVETEEIPLPTTRDGDERSPISAHVKSIYGADAIVEVVLGQGRLLTTKRPIANDKGTALIAVGDPSVVDFEILPNPRMIRLLGKRPGVTDLVITTEDEQTLIFEVHVIYDLMLVQTSLRQLFPDNQIKLSQLRDHVVLDGQARSGRDATMIYETLRTYLTSLSVTQSVRTSNRNDLGALQTGPTEDVPPNAESAEAETPTEAALRTLRDSGARADITVTAPVPQIINLMRVPGVQQVMLQVQVAELNRTSLREIGADLFFESGSGNRFGTQLSGASQTLNGIAGLGSSSTAFGIFPSGNVEIVLRALRDNSILSVLAEPNLMALNGQKASFLAGGQFPVPVPQGSGINTSVTVQFKDFGVSLDFVPDILDDDTIRLQVAPEVSSIDESLGTVLVVGGTPVPGISTRRVQTTVELKQGQTLELAGLLQIELDARTQRIPGLGDLPYLGPFFSNTSHQRIEKELLVLVTPHMVHPMSLDQVGPLPGSEIEDPNDLEFYLLNRIEGRTGQNFRSTMSWDNPWHLVQRMKLEKKHLCGPVGHSD